MTRPRIGITTSLEDGRQTLDRRYVVAVERAGGLPVIVPMSESADAATSFAALLDGLIISGGPGITRGLIAPLPEDLPAVDEARDRSDELIYRAMADRPFLGICYGMQFANAMAGGTIFGDAQRQCAAADHSAERGAGEHEIQIEPGSRLASILGVERCLPIASYSGGGRSGLRDCDRPRGRRNGVNRGIESADGRVMAVQFHPERMLERGLPCLKIWFGGPKHNFNPPLNLSPRHQGETCA